MEGLAPLDAWAVAAIVAKAIGYGAALLAMGGALYLAVFSEDRAGASAVARLTAAIALAGLLVLALRFGLRAARISGMGLDGATDPMMLGLVWDSPLGQAAIWRIAGFALIVLVLLPGVLGRKLGRASSVVGAVVVAASYAQVGHSLGDPRWAMASLLILHLLAVAFWVGALIPLWRIADRPGGADVLHRFGTLAAWIVGLLVVVGLIYAWLLSGSPAALLGTAYGALLLSKVALVGLLLGLAALNKLRLVPAIAQHRAQAPSALRRSIAFEGATVAFILFATATMTSVTVPPVNL